MNKIIVFILVSLVSVSVFADHHKGDRDKGDRDKGAGSERGRGDFFKEADRDGDEKVSYAEHEAMVQNMSDRGRARFQEMDSDADGFVTKTEARKSREGKRKGMREKRKAMENERKTSSED
jgi:hypothetical protein